MTPTPPRLVTVATPETFPATRLASLDACALSVVARDGVGRPGVVAGMGTLLHGFAEAAQRDGSVWGRSWHEALAALDAYLSSHGTTRHTPPAGVTALRWAEACHQAVRYALRATPMNGTDGVRKEGDGGGGGRPFTTRVSGTARSDVWSDVRWRGAMGVHVELGFVDEVTRVVGRMDRVEFTGETVVVTDQKTGHPWTREGELTRSVRLQLSAYGAYLRRVRPESAVMLVVEASQREAWTYGEADAAAVDEVVTRARLRLPIGVSVDAPGLASPGEACLRCGARDVCPVYPGVLVGWNTSGADHPFADDIFGVVERVEAGFVDVRTDEGRLARLRSVPDSMRASIGVGVRVETYGRGRSRDREGRWVAPTTYNGIEREYYVGD